jgi:hypothetical protein
MVYNTQEKSLKHTKVNTQIEFYIFNFNIWKTFFRNMFYFLKKADKFFKVKAFLKFKYFEF